MRNCDKKRNKVNLRLAPPNYLIICEGKETEPNYFNGLKKNIKKNYGDKIDVLIPNIDIEGTGRNTVSLIKHAQKVVNRSNKVYKEVWIVFDKDDYNDKQFNNAIKLNEYKSAWSNPNFEFWLLTHFKKLETPITKQDTFKKLEKEFQIANLGSYSKNDKKIFEKVTNNNRLKDAIQNCKEIYNKFENRHKESDKNPCTTVFMLVESLSEYLE